MDASVFPLMMGHDAVQVLIPLPIPRALRSETAATDMYSSTYSSVYAWAGLVVVCSGRSCTHSAVGRRASERASKQASKQRAVAQGLLKGKAGGHGVKPVEKGSMRCVRTSWMRAG